jgi:hypothetical protein
LARTDYDSPLLTELRENFDYLDSQWRAIYDDGRTDMRYLSGDPWDPKERRAREHADRLILTFDELNQYTNQVINNYRQNPRSVRVVPKGLGATEETAQKRAGMIREIEYKSKAQAAIRTAFEGAVQRGFGYYKFKTQFVSDSSWDQEVAYVRVPNPETILVDWDCKEADCSDMGYAFEFDTMPKRAYRSKYKNATYQFFNNEFTRMFPAWVKSDRVMVANYWKLERDEDTLFQFANESTAKLSEISEQFGKPKKVGANYIELQNGDTLEFLKRRKVEKRRVCQYLTNGLEILEEHEWPGENIPIIPVFGREIWVDQGAGAERKLLSLVRLARSPFMAYCYTRTAQMELVQQSPKAMFAGFVGQFDTNTDFKNIHKIPTAYAEFNLTTPQSEEAAANGGGGDPRLPLPQRLIFDASGIQAMEITANSCRQAIQSAMGITGLLNGTEMAAAPNSGKALQALDAQESTGNFHFVDNLDMAIENGGRQLNTLLTTVYDGTRSAGMRTAAGVHSAEQINVLGPDGQPIGFQTDAGEHDVDVSTGPSAVNQAQSAADFAEDLLRIPEAAMQVMDLIIKMRNLGPLGDEMADRFDPAKRQPGLPPQVAAQFQQLQGTVQQLMQERQAETVKMQGQLQKATMEQQTQLQKQRMQTIGVIAAAMIKAGYSADQAALERQLTADSDQWERQHEGLQASAQLMHDAIQSEAQRQHERAQTSQQQQFQAQQPQPPVQPQG